MSFYKSCGFFYELLCLQCLNFYWLVVYLGVLYLVAPSLVIFASRFIE
jgi:hypothetical protein